VLDPRDVTHTVRRLEIRGLVSRKKDPNHGRKVLVSLTDAGVATTGQLDRVMADVQDEVFGRLSQDERNALLGLLERVAT
jgi:DNA-binding MarR family transcriptional regulator